MKSICIIVLCIIVALLLVFGLTCLSALVFMLLWNWILPLFGVIKLTFWQSWGAIILLGIVGSCFKSKNYNDIQNKLNTLKEDWKVGRVIARPYVGHKKGEFKRAGH